MMQAAPKTSEALQSNQESRSRFGPRVWKEVNDFATRNGMQVFAYATAWFTSDIKAKWLQYNFAFNSEPAFLLLDEFSGHQTVDVAAAAKKLNVHIMSIPPGLTSKSQPADLSWNKPFKGYMRHQWTNKLIHDMKEKGDNFRATAPSREDVLNWVKESWNYLSKETIINGFVKANLIDNVANLPNDHIQILVEQDIENLIEVLEKKFGVAYIEDNGNTLEYE